MKNAENHFFSSIPCIKNVDCKKYRRLPGFSKSVAKCHKFWFLNYKYDEVLFRKILSACDKSKCIAYHIRGGCYSTPSTHFEMILSRHFSPRAELLRTWWAQKVKLSLSPLGSSQSVHSCRKIFLTDFEKSQDLKYQFKKLQVFTLVWSARKTVDFLLA